MGLYRRVYRQKRTSLADAGGEAICGEATFSGPSSISPQHTENYPFSQLWLGAAGLAHNFSASVFSLLLCRATLICAFPALLTRIEVAY